ncbi:hypothetical protein [Stutzerimonas stutzeri]|uniref:hypothetical protein n=1 Tax=Stutzerimonas stutzeri TaxID=316 RepID=UPI000F73ECAB|nr:hypothetical protein [Stutzerimonas stutzeri]
MKFFAAPVESFDYCILSFQRVATEGIIRTLKASVSGSGLLVELLSPSLVVISSVPIAKALQKKMVLSGSVLGLSKIKNCFFNVNLDECVGSFTAIKFSKKEAAIAVSGDYFGLGIFYVYSCGEFSLIANRLHVAAVIAHKIGDAAVNNEFISTLAFTAPSFLQQPMSNMTPLLGLERVPVGRKAILCNGSLSFEDVGIRVDQEKLGEALKERGDQYLFYLKRGIEEVKNNIKRIFELAPPGEIVLDLSGGKDSRMVLAAAKAVLPPEKLKLYAKDVPGSNDLNIACLIASRYDLEFYDLQPNEMATISLSEAFDLWRSYYFGEYHALGLPSFSSLGKSRLTHLSGGCGEVVTSTAKVNWLRKLADGEANYKDFFVRAIDKYCGKVDKNLFVHKENALRLYSSFFSELEASDVDHALNRFYLEFRNRVHFGLKGLVNYHDAEYVFPLMSRSLYLASLELTEEDRTAGRLVFDFISSLDEELALVPYDSNFPSAESKSNYRNFADLNETDLAALKVKKDQWHEAQRRYLKSRANSIKETRSRKQEVVNLDSFLFKKAVMVLHRMFEEKSLIDVRFKDHCISRLADLFLSNSRHGAYYASYIISIGDFFFCDECYSLDVERYLADKGLVLPLISSPIDAVHFDLVDSTLSLNISLLERKGGDEFAVYRYENGVLVQRVWYGKSSSFSFNVCSGIQYSFTVFVRRDGVVYKKQSSYSCN